MEWLFVAFHLLFACLQICYVWLQMYPGWSARDNYAVHKKRRKRKTKNEKGPDEGVTIFSMYICTLISYWCNGCQTPHLNNYNSNSL